MIDRRHRTESRIAAAICMTMVFLVIVGCALRVPFGPRRPIGPPVTTYQGDSTAVVTDVPYDSLARLLEQITKDATADFESRPSRVPAVAEPETLIIEGPDPLAAAEAESLAVADSIVTPVIAPTVSVDLPEAQRQELKDAAVSEIAETNSLLIEVEERTTTEEEKEKLHTIRSLIEQAEAALEREDIQAAANLAHKAKLLAEELRYQ